MRRPFILDAEAVVRELALRAVLLVIEACFPFNAVATSPITGNETDATLRAELDVSVGCFPFSAVATFTPAIVTAATLRLLLVVSESCFAPMVVAISTPAKYSRGVNRLD